MNWQVSNFHTMRAALRKMCLALEQDAVAENSVFDCKLIASELLCNALRYGGGCTAFEAELRTGSFTVTIPALGSDVYHLLYTGKSISYGLNLGRSFGHFTMKCEEPNPADRE